MSAESGPSGVGIGAGVAAGSVGGISRGFAEAGGLTSTSFGGSAMVATAEIGASPSIGLNSSDFFGGRSIPSTNPFAGTQELSMSPSLPGISMDTTLPGRGNTFHSSDYATLWSLEAPAQKATIAPSLGIHDSLQTPDLNPPFDSTNTDALFSDIGTFLMRSPSIPDVPIEQTVSDIDAYLSNHILPEAIRAPSHAEITDEELKADSKQTARVLEIIKNLEQEVETEDARVLQRLAVKLGRIQLEASPQPEGQTMTSVIVEEEAQQSEQITAPQVVTEQARDATRQDRQVQVEEAGEVIEPVVGHEDEIRPRKMKTAIHDEIRNDKRVEKIADAFEEAGELTVKQLEEAGMQPEGDVLVSGAVAAQILVEKGVESDDEIESTIVPEHETDKTIIHTLNAIADVDVAADELSTGSAIDVAEGVVREHPAITINYEPTAASKEQVEEVFDEFVKKSGIIYQAKSSLHEVAA